VHNAYGYGLFTGGLGAHYGAERLGCTVVPMSGGGTERQVTLLQDFGANVLCATPSYALNIAEVAAAMNVDLRRSSLRIGVFGRSRGASRCGACWRIARHQGRGPLRLVGNLRSRRRSDVRDGAGRPARLEIISCSSDHPKTLAPRPSAKAASSSSPRSPSRRCDDPLSHARHHASEPRAMRLWPHPCAHHARDRRDDDMLIIRGVNVYPSQVEAVLVNLPDLRRIIRSC